MVLLTTEEAVRLLPIPASMLETQRALRAELYKPIMLYDQHAPVTSFVLDPTTGKEIEAVKKNADGTVITAPGFVTRWIPCPNGNEMTQLRERVWTPAINSLQPSKPCSCTKLYHEIIALKSESLKIHTQTQYYADHPEARVSEDSEEKLHELLESTRKDLEDVDNALRRWGDQPPTPPTTMVEKVCTYCHGTIPVPANIVFSEAGIYPAIAEIIFEKPWQEVRPMLLATTMKTILMHLASWFIGIPEGLPDPSAQFLGELLKFVQIILNDVRLSLLKPYLQLPQK